MNRIERIRDIDRRKKEIEVLLEEYRLAILAYAEWMDAWRKRCIADGVAKNAP